MWTDIFQGRIPALTHFAILTTCVSMTTGRLPALATTPGRVQAVSTVDTVFMFFNWIVFWGPYNLNKK